MKTSVTVITVTRNRPLLLQRAIKSVLQQDTSLNIIHRIVIDDCSKTLNAINALQLPPSVVYHFCTRKPLDQSGPGRLSVLRNYAVRKSATKWVAFLDDDNEFEPHHLSSLLELANSTGYRALHSHRRIFWRDGNPFLEQFMPWRRDKQESKRLYELFCAEGIMEIGSNILKDRSFPWSNIEPALNVVDTGVWLLRKDLLLEHPFSETYSFKDWENGTTEDDKLLVDLVENNVPIASTNLPTLKYYLGGYSNDFKKEQKIGEWVNEQEFE